MNKLDLIKQHVMKVMRETPEVLDSKDLRSIFYKKTAKKFNVSWQTVVGVYVGIPKSFKTPTKVNVINAQPKKIKQAQFAPEPYKNGDPQNVLVIGDPHEPFCKDGYLEFCRAMQEKYNCGTIVHIGDAVDNHAISYHESDPSGRSAGDEFNLAKERMKRWYHTFPVAKVCIGNHDALPFRKIFSAGLPKEWLKSYQELLESPKEWEWDFVHQVNGVIYQHGTGMSGEMAAVNAARENRQSTVIGHLHTVCNTRFLASYKDLIFGVTVGCGIDHSKYAFAYGREQTRKPVLACAVVLDGKTPINLTMPLNYK